MKIAQTLWGRKGCALESATRSAHVTKKRRNAPTRRLATTMLSAGATKCGPLFEICVKFRGHPNGCSLSTAQMLAKRHACRAAAAILSIV